MIPLRDKREFIYKYAANFAVLGRVKWFPYISKAPEGFRLQIRYLAQMARVELGYSEKTGSGDIVHHLQGKYDEMREIQLFN